MIGFIAQNFIVLVFSVLTPIVMMYVHKLMTEINKRWKLENSAEYEAQISDLVITAIKGIEQKTENIVDDALKTQKGKEKLQEAITWVNNELAHRNLPQLPPEQLAMKIEAKLWDEVEK